MPHPTTHDRAQQHAPQGEENADAALVRAPFAGYLTLLVREGTRVAAGERLAMIEALKVETMVTARVPGQVAAIFRPDGSYVAGGQKLLKITPPAVQPLPRAVENH